MGNGQSRDLFEAAASNDLPHAQALLQQDIKVNQQDKDGWTALHWAAYGGSLEVTQALLQRGADPTITDKAHRSPLHLAALQGHTTVSSLLIGRGSPVDSADENSMTPLHKAAVKGHTEVGEQLIRLGANINAEVKDGTRPIHLAAWKGHLEFVKLLLARGADYRAVKKNGQTALHEAAEAGHGEVVQLLLSVGADGHAQDKDGQIPASLASHAGHRDIAELIARGAGAPPQASRAGQGPSAPPLPGASGHANANAALDSPVHYPQIYSPQQPAPNAEEQRNQDFWAQQGVGKQAPEAARNQNFWSSALGGESTPNQPAREDPSAEAARNKAFWDEKLAQRVPQPAHDWDARVGKAADAWDKQLRREEESSGMMRGSNAQEVNPRRQFEEGLLKQAQGLWALLQGKGETDEQRKMAEQRRVAERKRQEAQAIDDEWGGQATSGGNEDWAGAKSQTPKVPTQELYNLKPYDDDDYKDEGPAPKGAAQPRGAQETVAARRRLAQLELELDRDQGWTRGGSKAEAHAAKERQQRIKEQEAEIMALKRQLAQANVYGHQRGYGGKGGMRAMDDNAPAEYLCPITCEIMNDPVIAGDGYSYERSAIQQWLDSGHNSSPMTGGLLPRQPLTPNNALRSAIREWQGR